MNPREQIENYLERIRSRDFRRSLASMEEACALLGQPQECYGVVHIAGTNGKGSTAAFLNAILQEAGYTVGLMTSPHLIDVTERIQINREPIAWEALWEILVKIRHRLSDSANPPDLLRGLAKPGLDPADDFLSYFEIMTLAGFEYFSQMDVDLAVVETGMGGRLDATNVVRPQVAVLTPISHDHEKFLGETLLKIAQEKCGILKAGVSVVSARQPEEAAFVIEEHCEKLGLELLWADPEKIITPLGLKGAHQKTNAACAFSAAQLLLAGDLLVKVAARALQKTAWPGRLQYLAENFLIDCAHNSGGIRALADYLAEAHPGQKITFLLGCLEDKNWQTMFEPLVPLAGRFVCLTPPSERALPAAVLANHLARYEKPVSCLEKFDTPPAGELTVATGSIYMIGAILKCLHSNA